MWTISRSPLPSMGKITLMGRPPAPVKIKALVLRKKGISASPKREGAAAAPFRIEFYWIGNNLINLIELKSIDGYFIKRSVCMVAGTERKSTWDSPAMAVACFTRVRTSGNQRQKKSSDGPRPDNCTMAVEFRDFTVDCRMYNIYSAEPFFLFQL